jgi:hypothetical protein
MRIEKRLKNPRKLAIDVPAFTDPATYIALQEFNVVTVGKQTREPICILLRELFQIACMNIVKNFPEVIQKLSVPLHELKIRAMRRGPTTGARQRVYKPFGWINSERYAQCIQTSSVIFGEIASLRKSSARIISSSKGNYLSIIKDEYLLSDKLKRVIFHEEVSILSKTKRSRTVTLKIDLKELESSIKNSNLPQGDRLLIALNLNRKIAQPQNLSEVDLSEFPSLL